MSTLLITTQREQSIIRTLGIAFCACAALYGALVLSVVFNTVDRQNYERNIRETSGILGDLESQYMAQAKTINISFARSFGFEDATQVKFTKKHEGLGVAAPSRNGI